MKFVFLDVKTIGDDIDLSRFDLFGEVVKYPFSTQQEVPERIQDADVIIVNKIQVNEASIGAAKNLKIGLCHCHRHKQSGQGIFRQTRDCVEKCCRILYRISCPAYFCHVVLSSGTSAILR